MPTESTPEELEADLGGKIKALRLLRNIDRATLAERAGISESALKNLELGKGSSLKTLMSVVRALGRQDWLKTLAPIATVSPMTMTKRVTPRLRASRRRTTPKPKDNHE